MKTMKKLAALLCAVAMMLSMSAWAEPAAVDEPNAGTETVLYENSEYGFSMEIPADWTLMDKQNIDELLAGLASGDSSIEGFDASSLQQYADQIKSTNMVVMIAPGGNTNANMVVQDAGMEITAEQFVSLVFPNVLSQYEGIFSDFAADGDPTVVTYGEHDYAVFSCTYTANGMTGHLAQAYYCAGNTMYCLSFTTFETPTTDLQAASDVLDVMLNTLTYTA